MNKVLAALVATIIVGCAATTQNQNTRAMTVNTAVEDFIEVEELTEIDVIRSRQQLHHTVITEKNIIIHDRRASYLATFRRRCRELNDTDVTPDLRYDLNTIHADSDTFRGCKIDSIYELSDGQAEELKSLADT